MNGVIIVPTGLGAEIGGHAGDANPVVKLFSSICDNVITHPNVCNASDINEMTEKTLYVEGSILDRFLQGEIGLKKVNYNKILLATNLPVLNETINAVSAARATIGADISIIGLKTPLMMHARIEDNHATGDVFGWQELIEQVKEYEFDALALATPIIVDYEVAMNYMRVGGINPWGGIEAKASKLIANFLNKPVAHSPNNHTLKGYNEISDPRMAAEIVSMTYLHCILKGLHKAPRITTFEKGLNVDSVDFMISPYGCLGIPHQACLDRNIPVIMVKENKTCLDIEPDEKFIIVENYWEAAGYVLSMKSGVLPSALRRPLKETIYI